MKAPTRDWQAPWRVATVKWLVQNHTRRSRNGVLVVRALSSWALASASNMARESVMDGGGVGWPGRVEAGVVVPGLIVEPEVAAGVAATGLSVLRCSRSV